MKLVAISDTHGKWKKLEIPPCDILVSAGDYSFQGERHIIKNFHEWLNKQPAKHIISVQGNHEVWVQENFQEAKELALSVCPRVHFIEHDLIEIEGLKIFGSAWTPWFLDWAYNAHRGPEIKRYWDQIPLDIDILITHGPPAGILDVVYNRYGVPQERVGCQDLMDTILKCPNLKNHFFGHLHGSHGYKEFMDKHFWNVAICGETYTPDYEPTIVEI